MVSSLRCSRPPPISGSALISALTGSRPRSALNAFSQALISALTCLRSGMAEGGLRVQGDVDEGRRTDASRIASTRLTGGEERH